MEKDYVNFVYKHSYSEQQNNVIVSKLAVKDCERCYIGTISGRKYLKSKMNLIQNGQGNPMYCLEPKPDFYLKALLLKEKIQLDKMEENIQKQKELLENISNSGLDMSF